MSGLGHDASVGWSESFDAPPTAQARCSCGWVGAEIEVEGGKSLTAARDRALDDHDDHVIASTRSPR